MLIECENVRPVPSFPPIMDNPKRGRLPLSALCNSLSQYTHPLPHSSRVTSPSRSSSSQQQPPSTASHIHRQSPSPSSVNYASRIEPAREQPLPSINDLSFVSCPRNHASQLSSPPDQCHNYTYHETPTGHSNDVTSYPTRVPARSLPSDSTSVDLPLTRSTSELPNPTKYHSARPADDPLARAYEKFETKTLSTLREVSRTVSPYSRRRYSSQTSSRVCTNCGVLQTRQWVRGENHAWLCHSCGQFWRKNGYPRPRALWNRPTFKRSSRKAKVGSPGIDGSRRLKGSTRQTVSSSFINGKKMVQWGIRLPPLNHGSKVNDFIGTRTGCPSRSMASAGHVLRRLTDESNNCGTSQSHFWRSRSTVL